MGYDLYSVTSFSSLLDDVILWLVVCLVLSFPHLFWYCRYILSWTIVIIYTGLHYYRVTTLLVMHHNYKSCDKYTLSLVTVIRTQLIIQLVKVLLWQVVKCNILQVNDYTKEYPPGNRWYKFTQSGCYYVYQFVLLLYFTHLIRTFCPGWFWIRPSNALKEYTSPLFI